MHTLDEAIAKTIRDDSSAEAAMLEAAAQWRIITGERGDAGQLRAYRRGLGIDAD